MEKKYELILKMPRHISRTRPQMTLSRRAAQFAPFAALTGYDGAIRETARQTETEVTLDETEIAAIDRCLRSIRSDIALRPGVCVRFFCPDGRKSGGSFQVRYDKVIKIDENLQEMMLESGENIQFCHIVQIMRQ